MALGAIAIAMFVRIGRPALEVLPKRLDTEGLQFGLTNFLSGGIPLVFVPAATVMCGTAFAGMLSLLSSVTAIGMLLPRAISMTQLADFARRKAASLSLDDSLRTMSRNIGWCNGAMLVFNVILVLLLAARPVHGATHQSGVIVAGVLLAIQCAVGMMGIANSSILMVFERGGSAAKINVFTTSAFALLAVPCYAYGGQSGLVMILCAAIAVTVWRNWLIRSCARQIHSQYVNLCGSPAVSDVKCQVQPLACGASR
ncbi:hypothetical protein ACFQI9_29745 [Paraburkholderia dipogonis]